MQCSLDDLKSQATVRLSKTWTHDVVCRAGPTTTIVPTWTEPVFLAKKVCMRIVMLDEHRQEVSVQGEVTPPIHSPELKSEMAKSRCRRRCASNSKPFIVSAKEMEPRYDTQM